MNRSTLLAPFAVLTLAGSAFAYPFSFTATDTPQSGPEPTPVVSTIIVGETGIITDLDAFVDYSSSFTGDVTLTLTHVDTGTSVVVFDHHGGAGSNISGVTFDDEASTFIGSVSAPFGPGSFQPANALSAFDGQQMFGTWTLTATDDVNDSSGHSINSFGLGGTATPEPGTLALFGIGAAACAAGVVRRRRLKKTA